MITRRDALTALGLATFGLAYPAVAHHSGTGAPDEDMALGAADAPVTMIEYSSLTCPHCAYSLTGLTSMMCPECGHPFVVHTMIDESAEKKPQKKRRRRREIQRRAAKLDPDRTCHKCGYPQKGLGPDRPCPQCGTLQIPQAK